MDREGPSHSPPCGQLLAWMKQQASVPGRGPFWEKTADPSQPSLTERKTLGIWSAEILPLDVLAKFREACEVTE